MNLHFRAKATKKEQAFFRKYGRVGYTFFTVKGNRPNTIQKVTDQYVYVTTEKSSRPNRIPRSSLRRALAFLFYRRVTTLKALIKLNSFSSALAGLLKTIMSDICKVIETKSGAVRLTLRGVRFIFSGLSKARNDVRIVKENGGQFILLNYVNLRSDPTDSWKANLRDLGFDYKCVILDPGAKTIAEAELKGKSIKPIEIDEYAAFVKRHADIIFQYLTLDIIGDPHTTRENTLYLERAVGIKPIPIFHVQNSLDVLEEMIEEDKHDVIAIGGSVLVSRNRRKDVFTEIFARYGERVNFHALGVGSTSLLMDYPWFSGDASSWLNGRIFKSLITLTGNVKAPAGMSSEDALGFNIRTLASLEDRYTDIQMDFGLMPPEYGAQIDMGEVRYVN